MRATRADKKAHRLLEDASDVCRRSVSRAVRIVEEGLKGGLDLQSGGEIAANLSLVYGYVSQRLTMANLQNDDAMLQQCAELIQPLREAWTQIGAAVATQPLVVNG